MSKFVRLTCVFVLAGMAAFAQSTVPSVVRTSGMVGLAYNQMARLNLLNPGVLPPATGIACSANIAFVNAAGTVIKTAPVSVAPGKSEGVTLDSLADLNLAVAAREEIRAVVTLPAATPVAASSTAVPACKLIPTLEVFDSLTGRTLVVLGRLRDVPAAAN